MLRFIRWIPMKDWSITIANGTVIAVSLKSAYAFSSLFVAISMSAIIWIMNRKRTIARNVFPMFSRK